MVRHRLDSLHDFAADQGANLPLEMARPCTPSIGDEHIRRYAELLEARRKVSQQNASKPKSPPQGGRPKGVPRQIAECDENLCSSSLTPSEKALFTARRKEAYEALHPETKHGTPGVSRQVGDTRDRTESDRFTADTAAKTGESERTIQRNAERGITGISCGG